MAFGYVKDVEAGDKGIPRTVMRPRIPIRTTNVRSARRGGSDGGCHAEALADSGADHAFITRNAPDRAAPELPLMSEGDAITPPGDMRVECPLLCT